MTIPQHETAWDEKKGYRALCDGVNNEDHGGCYEYSVAIKNDPFGVGVDRLSAGPIIGASIWNFHICHHLFFNPMGRYQEINFKPGAIRLRCSHASLSLLPFLSPALSHPRHHLIG